MTVILSKYFSKSLQPNIVQQKVVVVRYIIWLSNKVTSIGNNNTQMKLKDSKTTT